jgi:phosphoglycerol geranylgeranyltransferase
MIAAVRKQFAGVLIVGGGVSTPEKAKEIAKAGADIIVVGTMIEKDDDWENKLSSIIRSIRR